MEQSRKMVYRNKRPRPSRRSSLQRFRWTLSTWKQKNLCFIKMAMRRLTRVHNRCSCLLTVRKTDASSRTTEYTSPLLLMKTCVGRKKTVEVTNLQLDPGQWGGGLPKIHGPPGGYAKPRETPDPKGCQRYCSLWSWTQPCLPCLAKSETSRIKDHRVSMGVINRQWSVVTLPSYNQTCHAVWNTGSRCQEGDAHDVIWDV